MAKKWGRFGAGSIGKLGKVSQTKIVGLNEVLNNLNREILQIKGRSAKGLVESAILIRRATEKSPPKTPVDTGNLRASWFAVSSEEGPIDDPEGYSGKFKKNPKTGESASVMKANHATAIGAAKAGVNAVRSKGPVVIMGCSANYALFVHEMEFGHPGVRWAREGSGGKWLEAAFKTNKNKIIETVKKNAKVE